MEQPVYYWDPVIAPSGMAFYQGDLFPQWKNSVFVSGLRGIGLYRLEIKNDKVVAEEPMLTEQKLRIRDDEDRARRRGLCAGGTRQVVQAHPP